MQSSRYGSVWVARCCSGIRWVSAVAATLVLAGAGPTWAGERDTPHDHKMSWQDYWEDLNGVWSGDTCPPSRLLNRFLPAPNVSAAFSNSGDTTTYWFFSTLTETGPVDGVPGLIKYCVYPTEALPPNMVVVSASGANGEAWTSHIDLGNFTFERPDKDPSNIPFDGNNVLMGTATWNTLPSDQTILLQIRDPQVCSDLYGKDFCNNDYGSKTKELLKSAFNDAFSKGEKMGHMGHHKFHKKVHKMGASCFVKPSRLSACDQGDTTLAYNANSFGAVNCVRFSHGFEAQATNELGDEVTLGGSARDLVSLNVLFSSYGCSVSGHWYTGATDPCVTNPGDTFEVPVTAKIYEGDTCNTAGCTPGALLATATQTFALPYRPSADTVNCTGADVGKWFNPFAPSDGTLGACRNSISKLISFTDWIFLTPSGATLPDDVIWTVAFDTTHWGYNPIGDPPRTGAPACWNIGPGCPYDSLNVGITSCTGAPYAGVDVNEDVAFRSFGGVSSPLLSTLGWSASGGLRPLGEIVTQ